MHAEHPRPQPGAHRQGGDRPLAPLADKDFIGETLGLPVGERAEGTIASLAVCAWLGARVFRVHDVPAARAALAAVAALLREG